MIRLTSDFNRHHQARQEPLLWPCRHQRPDRHHYWRASARAAREHTGRRQITGTWGELKPVFADLGMNDASPDRRGRLSRSPLDLLVEMLDVKAQRRHETGQRSTGMVRRVAHGHRARAQRRQHQVFLLTSGRHWVLVQRDSFVCGLTGEVVRLRPPEGQTLGQVHPSG